MEPLLPAEAARIARLMDAEIERQERALARDFERALGPREERVARLEALVGLHPRALGAGPISRALNPFWRTRP